ncbi:MAG: YHS domain-containing protein [Ignavibacteriales bacterium]
MKNLIVFTFVLFLCAGVGINAQQKEKKQVNKQEVVKQEVSKSNTAEAGEKVFNKVCPVSGEDLEDNNHTYTYNGKTYGLCCNKCLTKFKKDPAKYAARLNEDGTKLKKK